MKKHTVEDTNWWARFCCLPNSTLSQRSLALSLIIGRLRAWLFTGVCVSFALFCLNPSMSGPSTVCSSVVQASVQTLNVAHSGVVSISAFKKEPFPYPKFQVLLFPPPSLRTSSAKKWLLLRHLLLLYCQPRVCGHYEQFYNSFQLGVLYHPHAIEPS